MILLPTIQLSCGHCIYHTWLGAGSKLGTNITLWKCEEADSNPQRFEYEQGMR